MDTSKSRELTPQKSCDSVAIQFTTVAAANSNTLVKRTSAAGVGESSAGCDGEGLKKLFCVTHNPAQSGNKIEL
jgi:hypothetical protein